MGHANATTGADGAPTTEHHRRLDAANAATVATTLQALATPSRLLILSRLREGPCAATELAAEVGLEQSACSHQLRLLRNLGMVTGERRGRSVVYALYDSHVAELLDQAIYHVEHLRLGLRDTPRPADPDHPEPAAAKP
jgi:DNA-binding transcriptional ArsR family regulator